MAHYYDPQGQPAYTQIVASGKNKGKERDTTLRDARKFNLVPSVTTVLSILDKPALTSWKVKNALHKFGWEIAQWLPAMVRKRFITQYKITEPDMEDKAKRGSEIHAAIEKWLLGGGIDEGYEPYITIVEKVFAQLDIKLTDDIRPEYSFTAKEGYGGAIDLPVFELEGIILDFKTKDMDAKKAEGQLAYDEHAAQLAAYRVGVGRPNARCFNLFLSRDNPEVYKLHEWTEEEVQHGENIFFGCLSLWKTLKKYDSTVGGADAL